MNEQQLFVKRISELVELAADQDNVIFLDQLYDIFPEVKEDEAKFAVIKEFLTEKRIGLDEKIGFENLVTEDEKTYLNFYLDELKKIEELSKGEREAYLMQVMSGEEDAKLLIMQDSLRNVVEFAKLYAGQGVLLEDLIGEGNLALVGAIEMLGSCDNVKEAEGLLASTVMDAMQDLIAENMDEKTEEEKALKLVQKISDAAKELADTLGRKVTVEELSQEMKISRNQIIKVLKLTACKVEDIEIPEELK